jgi:hypothetical protein
MRKNAGTFAEQDFSLMLETLPCRTTLVRSLRSRKKNGPKKICSLSIKKVPVQKCASDCSR